jgi:hypothetical protein
MDRTMKSATQGTMPKEQNPDNILTTFTFLSVTPLLLSSPKTATNEFT